MYLIGSLNRTLSKTYADYMRRIILKAEELLCFCGIHDWCWVGGKFVEKESVRRHTSIVRCSYCGKIDYRDMA